MDNQKLVKLIVAVVAVAVLYKLAKGWKAKSMATSRASSYVPFDEMPFDTVPPTAPGTSIQPINVASDLLPKPTTPQVMDFGEFAPNALQGQNFLEVSQQVGQDTQGSSMRNANYQLRADIPNPRVNVGPWSNSTIEADLYRRPLE